MYDLSDIAERIKLCAKNKKIALKDMLPACGLGVNVVSALSRGQQLSSISLAKIADYLGVSVDYLLGRTDNPEVNNARHLSSVLDKIAERLGLSADYLLSVSVDYLLGRTDNPEVNRRPRQPP